MKITLDSDYFNGEEFKQFISCLKERNYILKLMKELESGELEEFELCYRMHYNINLTLYLFGENLEKNKDYVKRTLELMLETNDRDTKNLMERLGIEHYE